VPKAKLSASSAVLNAANGSPISVKGETRLVFCVQHKQFYADLLVSDQIDELILGIDWLQRNDARWQFSDGALNLGELSVKLRCKPVESYGYT
jgi:hypothetical protein